MLNKKILEKIRAIALKTDWNKAFGGKSKGNKHLLRMVKISKFLARKTGANISIVEAGAWLHDISLPTKNDGDFNTNKITVKKTLKNLNLDNKEKEVIAECVVCHEGMIKAKTLEAKIVHDADVLEKSGLLGIIRHTWKLTNNREINPMDITPGSVRKLLNHIRWRSKRLNLSISKRINRFLAFKTKKENMLKIVSMISELADRGLITEKIAPALEIFLSKQQKDKLKSQLNLSYLRRF